MHDAGTPNRASLEAEISRLRDALAKAEHERDEARTLLADRTRWRHPSEPPKRRPDPNRPLLICAFPNYRVDLAITSWDDAWMPIVPYRGPTRR
jgi:hypothetical protein